MIEEKGNLWDYYKKGSFVCVTTNGTLKSDGTLIMGAGCAGEAAHLLPVLPAYFGFLISRMGNHCYLSLNKVISFPTIHNIGERSDLSLILKSSMQLKTLVDMYGIKKVYIPRPGCGIGGLDWESQVKPLISCVLTDDRFVVVTF